MEKSDLVIGKVYFHKLGGMELLYLGDYSVTKDSAYYFRYVDYEGKFQSSGFLLEEIEDVLGEGEKVVIPIHLEDYIR